MVSVGRIRKNLQQFLTDDDLKKLLEAVTKTNEKETQEQAFLLEEITEKTKSVKKIKPANDGEPYTYKIELDGKMINLSTDKMLTPSLFKRRYLEEFDEIIDITEDSWKRLIETWTAKQEVMENDHADLMEVVSERLFSKLSNCYITADIEKAYSDDNYMLCESYFGEPPITLLYASIHIQNFIKMMKVKVELKDLAERVKVYRIGIVQRRVDHINNRFWNFTPNFTDVNWVDRWEK